MKKRVLFTSESVTEGHPDKLADQVSDAILDAILAKDPQARVACETLVTTGLVHVVGEITTSSCGFAQPQIVTSVLRCKTILSENRFGSVTLAKAVLNNDRKTTNAIKLFFI